MGSIIRGAVTFLSRLRSGAIDLTNSRYEKRVADINRRDQEISSLADDALRRQAAAIRQRVQTGTRLDDVVNDAFAIVKEAARRTVGMQPYDVQVLAALALHDRKLVEMQTGEGKTLAAVLPASLRAFLGGASTS
jgi:preprotein translocase subunit SecA